jgi:hypothetical protein
MGNNTIHKSSSSGRIYFLNRTAVIDFGSPTHTVGNLPTTGSSTDTISSVIFGEPIVETSFGSLSNQSLVFNPNIHDYEQVELNVGLGHNNYKISFDIETNNLVGSLYSFNVILDTPEVQTLNFHGRNGYIYTFQSEIGSKSIGFIDDNSLIHVEIDVDLKNNKWHIGTGILPTYTGDFHAKDNDIFSIRFSLSPWYGGAALDPTVSVDIDNIVVSTTVMDPEPVPTDVPAPACISTLGLLLK